MNLIPIAISTNLRAAGYDASANTMRIEFTNGGLYEYYNIPIGLYHELADGGPNPWTRTNSRIRQYPYKKIG